MKAGGGIIKSFDYLDLLIDNIAGTRVLVNMQLRKHVSGLSHK